MNGTYDLRHNSGWLLTFGFLFILLGMIAVAFSFVFTLVSVVEGLPCSLLEAMSAGVAPLVSDIPAHTQLVDDFSEILAGGDSEIRVKTWISSHNAYSPPRYEQSPVVLLPV